MKMIKLRVTGANTFDWIATKYNHEGNYKDCCVAAFSESCFVGTNSPLGECAYTVEKHDIDKCKRKNESKTFTINIFERTSVPWLGYRRNILYFVGDISYKTGSELFLIQEILIISAELECNYSCPLITFIPFYV